MEVVNGAAIQPRAARRMAEPGPDGPIFMVNLLKFKIRPSTKMVE